MAAQRWQGTCTQHQGQWRRSAPLERLAKFEHHFARIAHPFGWKVTCADLNALIARMFDRWARSQSLKLVA